MMRRFFPSTIRQVGGGGLDIISINFQNSPNGVGGFNGVDFCEGSGLWTIAGERSTGGRIYHSSNGTSWTLSTYTSDLAYMRPANDGNNSVLSTRNTGGNRDSTNQTSWNSITVAGNQYQQCIWGGGVWLLTRNNNPKRSTDRSTWVDIVGTGLVDPAGKPSFGDGNFVVGNGTNGIYTSTDLGLTFSQTKTGSSSEIYRQVDYNPVNNTFLGFSLNNLITRSTDGGLNWSTPVAGPLISTAFTTDRIAYGGGMWIYMNNSVVAENNFFYSKDDGVTWNPASVTVPFLNWSDLHYSDSQQKFIAVADSSVTGTDVILTIELG